MTTLTIYADSLTAIETHNGDNIRYVESFPSWDKLIETLSPYFDAYAWIEIRTGGIRRVASSNV